MIKKIVKHLMFLTILIFSTTTILFPDKGHAGSMQQTGKMAGMYGGLWAWGTILLLIVLGTIWWIMQAKKK